MKTNIAAKALLFLPYKIFIAGKTQEDVLIIATRLNREGFFATVDALGEHSKSEEEAMKALNEYKKLIDKIRNLRIKTTVSIKLTHLGLKLGFGYCFNIVRKLVVHARDNYVGVEFDAEEFKYRDETIEIFKNLSNLPYDSRICLQANIFKSADDLIILHELGYPTRLVKGAYEESSDVAFYDQPYIKENFKSLINLAISKTILDRHNNVFRPRHAIGTRDKEIIAYARKLIETSPILDKNCIEFQLLYGYLPLGRHLLSEGYLVRIYLPYGDDQTALPYIWRRLKTPHTWILLSDWLLSSDKTRF